MVRTKIIGWLIPIKCVPEGEIFMLNYLITLGGISEGL